MPAWNRKAFALASLAAMACAGTDTDPKATEAACANDVVLNIMPDLGNADEAYVCHGFDAASVAETAVRGVHWSVGTGGSVTVHHAILYSVPTDYPDGPVPCGGMPPGGVELHVWSPGGSDLDLPKDVGLRLPEGTKRFVVETHLLRTGTGDVAESRVDICTGKVPDHEATFIGLQAPVPAIRPLHEEFSSGSCVLAGNVHLWSVWPHMHLTGKEILGELVRAEGGTEKLVDIVPWEFTNQKTYPLSVDAARGDSIRVSCTWDNTTDNTILPGPRTTDEMCNMAFIAWPAESAMCR